MLDQGIAPSNSLVQQKQAHRAGPVSALLYNSAPAQLQPDGMIEGKKGININQVDTIRTGGQAATHCCSLLNGAVKQYAEQVAPALAAAGICQLLGNLLCATKGLQFCRIQSP